MTLSGLQVLIGLSSLDYLQSRLQLVECAYILFCKHCRNPDSLCLGLLRVLHAWKVVEVQSLILIKIFLVDQVISLVHFKMFEYRSASFHSGALTMKLSRFGILTHFTYSLDSNAYNHY